MNCSALVSASLPQCTAISNYAFAYCLSLTTVLMPKCTTVGSSAFYSCVNLNILYLSDCQTIGSNAFAGCSVLSLYLLGSSVATPSYTVGLYGNFSIYVPASLYDTYVITQYWSTYSTHFVSLTDSEISALSFI